MATRKNIGGKARTRTLTLAEIEGLQNRAYEMGVESGLEAARRMTELKTPVTCPMCLLQREHDDLRQRIRVWENTPKRRGGPA